MPDWSYQTILRPVLRALPAAGRDGVARRLGALGRSRVGGRLVALVGDMEPGPGEAVQVGGQALASPVVVGHGLPGGGALDPLVARFGVGATAVQQVAGRWQGATVAEHVRDPGEALAALKAGADLVLVDDGLLASGPGLPKRINEALRHGTQAAHPMRWRVATLREPWTGMLGMGLVLLVAGLAAGIVGATRVLLPYDEAFLGTDRADLGAINPRLLDFLAHDRISFAATAASFAILFIAVAANAARTRERWARRLLTTSGLAGFASYFLFLGFGYLDPLHLVVWSCALAGFLWGVRGKDEAPARVPMPDLYDDATWRRGQWGQLLFVGLGFGLAVAGLSVCVVGVTDVFVSTDLGFLETTSADLDAANPRLLALIAHDRAGFGGALVANGLAVLLLSLWGMRRGARWVWGSLTAAGLVGFAGVLAIHLSVGYMTFIHMAPAYLALAVFLVASALTFSWLTDHRER